MHFIYTTPTDSHQPYKANITTMFYKSKNSFVTLINWTQKSKNVSLQKSCANSKW